MINNILFYIVIYLAVGAGVCLHRLPDLIGHSSDNDIYGIGAFIGDIIGSIIYIIAWPAAIILRFIIALRKR